MENAQEGMSSGMGGSLLGDVFTAHGMARQTAEKIHSTEIQWPLGLALWCYV